MEIDQSRLLVLKAAHAIDSCGTKAARKEVGMCLLCQLHPSWQPIRLQYCCHYCIPGNQSDCSIVVITAYPIQIAAIKVAVAQMACRVVDRAIQLHGGEGVSQDSFLPHCFAGARSLRIADGPDIVHLETVAKLELQPHAKL